jgi:hypothetical protein
MPFARMPLVMFNTVCAKRCILSEYRADFPDTYAAGGMRGTAARLLDEEVERFRDRPLEGFYPYVWADATYVKVREDGRSAVVIAVGVILGSSETKPRVCPLYGRGGRGFAIPRSSKARCLCSRYVPSSISCSLQRSPVVH